MKSEAITLPPEALEAFERLKMCCMMAPVLAFTDFEKEFQLETDASSEGLGTVLSQKQPDGKWHPITFRSRELKGGRGQIPLFEVGVPGSQVGHYGTVPRILAVSTIHHAYGQ